LEFAPIKKPAFFFRRGRGGPDFVLGPLAMKHPRRPDFRKGGGAGLLGWEFAPPF